MGWPKRWRSCVERTRIWRGIVAPAIEQARGRPVQHKVPTEDIERAIDNFQTRVAGSVAHAAPKRDRREAAMKVLAEALALARAEGVGLDNMKQMILDEYGKPLPKAEERAGMLVF